MIHGPNVDLRLVEPDDLPEWQGPRLLSQGAP